MRIFRDLPYTVSVPSSGYSVAELLEIFRQDQEDLDRQAVRRGPPFDVWVVRLAYDTISALAPASAEEMLRKACSWAGVDPDTLLRKP